jgi:hypothetical protein
VEIAKPDQYQDIRTSSKKNAMGRTFAIVLTIGHSARTLEEFIGLLQARGGCADGTALSTQPTIQ